VAVNLSATFLSTVIAYFFFNFSFDTCCPNIEINEIFQNLQQFLKQKFVLFGLLNVTQNILSADL
jgi:hypothetical protein